MSCQASFVHHDPAQSFQSFSSVQRQQVGACQSSALHESYYYSDRFNALCHNHELGQKYEQPRDTGLGVHAMPTASHVPMSQSFSSQGPLPVSSPYDPPGAQGVLTPRSELPRPTPQPTHTAWSGMQMPVPLDPDWTLCATRPPIPPSAREQDTPSSPGTSSLETRAIRLYRPPLDAVVTRRIGLVFNNNPDDIACHWTAEELSDKRRLVTFAAQRHGDVIALSCKTVAAYEHEQYCCISCISSEWHRDYVITSFDLLKLVESIGIAINKDERYRVRRNVEKYVLCTVTKPDDLWQVIMRFDHPKPRSIESRLKVYSWSVLRDALSDIMSKYAFM